MVRLSKDWSAYFVVQHKSSVMQKAFMSVQVYFFILADQV